MSDAEGRGIHALQAVTRTVPELDAAAAFYTTAMGFEASTPTVPLDADSLALLGMAGRRGLMRDLRLGAQTIGLLCFPGEEAAPYPPDSTSSDLWFQHCAVVVSDMKTAHARVMAAGACPISQDGPEHLPPNTGGVSAFKFRDPCGHPLELLFFPPGVGDATWHAAGGPLFRGIDHTAIAVDDAASSSRFYQEKLGFAVTDRSRNAGPEQVRLDAVPEDHVDVIALRAAVTPPHLELLAYLTGTRRRTPAGTPADIAKARTLARGNTRAIASNLHGRARQGRWQGSPAISFDDPDGHGWIVVEGI